MTHTLDMRSLNFKIQERILNINPNIELLYSIVILTILKRYLMPLIRNNTLRTFHICQLVRHHFFSHSKFVLYAHTGESTDQAAA